MDEQAADWGSAAEGGLGARLRAVRERAFVGRREELEVFREALGAGTPPFAVLHLHGPGGVGKSALLHRLAEEAREAGREPVVLDGRELDPSPTGFKSGLGRVLGVDPEEAVDTLRDRPAPILLVDTYELLAPLDGWIRDRLLPQMPLRALVVLAGRQPPGSAWRTDPAWAELLRAVEVRNLPAEDTGALLRSRGVPEAHHEHIRRITHGHPLALMLVTELVRGDEGDDPPSLEDAPAVLDALLQRFLRKVPSPIHRQALYAASHLGIATEGLLRDTLDTDTAGELFAWLRELSFTQSVATGVAVHELVADALNAELRWRDPDGWVDLHAAVTLHLEGRVARTSGSDRTRAIVDLIRLYRLHPMTRRFYSWDQTDELWLEPAAPEEHAELVSLVREREGEESAELAQDWLERQPEAFTVFHRHDGDRHAGFFANLLLDGDLQEPSALDPVVDAAANHIRRTAPARPGEQVRLMRFWVARETYQGIETHHLVSARAVRDWLETERLAWSFVVLADPDFYEPIFRFIDFYRVPGSGVEVGGRHFGLFARDWRRVPRREWMKLLRDRRSAPTFAVQERPDEAERLLVLAEDEFAEAVRDALRGLARPGGLDGNPLLRSRLVVERSGDAGPEEALAELLREVANELSRHPRDESKRRALELTYFSPAPTQEAAAERLDLPFSTFRRHLTAGIDHVTARLWELELHG